MKQDIINQLIHKLTYHIDAQMISNSRKVDIVLLVLIACILLTAGYYIVFAIVTVFFVIAYIYHSVLRYKQILTIKNNLAVATIGVIQLLLFTNTILFTSPKLIGFQSPKWFPLAFVFEILLCLVGFLYMLNSVKKDKLPNIFSSAVASTVSILPGVLGYVLARHFIPTLSLSMQGFFYISVSLWFSGMLMFILGMLYLSSWHFIKKLSIPDKSL